MKINLLTQKKNYIYSDHTNMLGDIIQSAPYWYPSDGALNYDVRKDGINFYIDSIVLIDTNATSTIDVIGDDAVITIVGNNWTHDLYVGDVIKITKTNLNNVIKTIKNITYNIGDNETIITIDGKENMNNETLSNDNETITRYNDISLIIGWEKPSIIDNITLDIDSTGSTYSKIKLQYSDDDFEYSFGQTTPFSNVSWYPQKGGTTDPIYLNSSKTEFEPFEAKMIKITFTNCINIVLNNIEIESNENINIDKNILELFVFEKFLNNVLPYYNDTDVKDLIEYTIKMYNGDDS